MNKSNTMNPIGNGAETRNKQMGKEQQMGLFGKWIVWFAEKTSQSVKPEGSTGAGEAETRAQEEAKEREILVRLFGYTQKPLQSESMQVEKEQRARYEAYVSALNRVSMDLFGRRLETDGTGGTDGTDEFLERSRAHEMRLYGETSA